MSARKCIVKYIIWLCIMIATTMTMTLLVANIKKLYKLFYSYEYTSIALLFTGAFIAVLLILIPKLEVIFPLNYMLAVLSVLTSSCGLAVATSNCAFVFRVILSSISRHCKYSFRSTFGSRSTFGKQDCKIC
ncbi:unnamed protein product [Trichobilharzia szidati]|nr:unnamed protein product [Trichobilharzia szidati]